MKTHAMFARLCMIIPAIMFTACPLLKNDDFLPAEDAQIELQAALQEINGNLDNFNQAPPLVSASFLMELVAGDAEWMSLLRQATKTMKSFTPDKSYSMSENSQGPHLHKTNSTGETGVYRYNFNAEAFDLINNQVNYLEYIYPANLNAFNNRTLNAALTMRNMEYADQQILKRINAAMVIDNQTVMTLNYTADINHAGLRLSSTYLMKMAPFEIDMSLEGSGQNYSSDMTLKEGSKTLMTHELTFRYTTSLDNTQKITGHYIAVPLRLEGEFSPEAMENCSDSDITCLNKAIDMTLKQTRLNKKIGTLEYRMHYDVDLEEEYPLLHIIFEDGSGEILDDILLMEFDGLKHGFGR